MAQQNSNLTGNSSADAPRSTPGGATGQGAPGQSIPAAAGGTASSGGGMTASAAATARSVVDTAKETAGQAYEVLTDKAATTIDEKKTTLATGLTSVADSLKQVGDSLGTNAGGENQLARFAAEYGRAAADRVERLGRYFETHDTRQMVRDVESFARRNPAVFIGAAFGLGLLAARFLKSSKPDGGMNSSTVSSGFDSPSGGALGGAAAGASTTRL
ncbi:MAG: hypothetical protein ACK4S4_01470 [Pyrinomonadaceae bacterium]